MLAFHEQRSGELRNRLLLVRTPSTAREIADDQLIRGTIARIMPKVDITLGTWGGLDEFLIWPSHSMRKRQGQHRFIVERDLSLPAPLFDRSSLGNRWLRTSGHAQGSCHQHRSTDVCLPLIAAWH